MMTQQYYPKDIHTGSLPNARWLGWSFGQEHESKFFYTANILTCDHLDKNTQAVVYFLPEAYQSAGESNKVYFQQLGLIQMKYALREHTQDYINAMLPQRKVT